MSEQPLNAIVLTHGDVGAALLDVARRISGEVSGLSAVGIGWELDPEAAIDHIERAIEEHGKDRELLILTDMFGGTSTNVGLSFLEHGHIELVTGVNLPMLLKLASLMHDSQSQKLGLSEVAGVLRDQGRRSIEVASELIENK